MKAFVVGLVSLPVIVIFGALAAVLCMAATPFVVVAQLGADVMDLYEHWDDPPKPPVYTAL